MATDPANTPEMRKYVATVTIEVEATNIHDALGIAHQTMFGGTDRYGAGKGTVIGIVTEQTTSTGSC